jgi:hypothetical protein
MGGDSFYSGLIPDVLNNIAEEDLPDPNLIIDEDPVLCDDDIDYTVDFEERQNFYYSPEILDYTLSWCTHEYVDQINEYVDQYVPNDEHGYIKAVSHYNWRCGIPIDFFLRPYHKAVQDKLLEDAFNDWDPYDWAQGQISGEDWDRAVRGPNYDSS